MCFEIFRLALTRLFAPRTIHRCDERNKSRSRQKNREFTENNEKAFSLRGRERESVFVVMVPTARRATEVFSRKFLPTSLTQV